MSLAQDHRKLINGVKGSRMLLAKNPLFDGNHFFATIWQDPNYHQTSHTILLP